MSYLGGNSDMIGGMLPAPHEGVRIVIGLTDNSCITLTYEGSPAALIAAGAIDAWMATAAESETVGRDIKLRPYTKQLLANGRVKITRTLASIEKAADLPGVRGTSVHVSPLKEKGQICDWCSRRLS